MLAFALRRLLSSIVVLLCVVSITFFLIRMMKGGPFDKEKEPPPHVKEAMLVKYKLNGTLWQQYLAYLRDLMHGDFRESFRYKDWRVAEVLGQKLPTSIVLGGIAFILASTGGVLLGGLAAVKRGGLVDGSAMLFALLAISMPTFITGPALLAVFGLWWRVLPIGGWGTWSQCVLPACCLAAPYLAYVARLMRNSLLDVLKSDFLRTAKAKGVGQTQAVVRHAMKVALLPVITFLGPLAANLLTGSMVVELVFNISGAGSVFVNALQNRDGFLLLGAVIIYCALIIFFNFVVDVLYGFLDPRIKVYG